VRGLVQVLGEEQRMIERVQAAYQKMVKAELGGSGGYGS
jgi:hypothetical protein